MLLSGLYLHLLHPPQVASLRQQLEQLQGGRAGGGGGGCGRDRGGVGGGCGPDAPCGRSLAAMEHAHRQALAELQRQHERQMKELEGEKDRLLEEETLATARGQLTTVFLFTCSFNHFKLCCQVCLSNCTSGFCPFECDVSRARLQIWCQCLLGCYWDLID